MDESNEPLEQEQPQEQGQELDQGPQIPAEPVPPITSRFLFVDVAALRAKQLRRGARLRLDEAEPVPVHKPERLAMEEVRRGLVVYDVPPPGGHAKDAGEEQ